MIVANMVTLGGGGGEAYGNATQLFCALCGRIGNAGGGARHEHASMPYNLASNVLRFIHRGLRHHGAARSAGDAYGIFEPTKILLLLFLYIHNSLIIFNFSMFGNRIIESFIESCKIEN